MQGSPLIPHAPFEVPGRQRPRLLQQPMQPVAALHTQPPPEHCDPGEHATPVPHWQAPPAHTLARVGSQGAPAPQVHTPLEQVSASGAQLVQAAPSRPQAATEAPDTHALPVQQPVQHWPP